jgi:hypothetical protein
MMRLRNKTFCTGLVLYNLLSLSMQAQPAGKDSLGTGVAYARALQLYHAYLVPETGLYRGGQYGEYAFFFKEGHPYFDENHMREGTILYNGVLYEHISLLFDLVKELVVINDPFNAYKIALINQQIDRFTIENHVFIHLTDSLNPSAPRYGYYEQLYKGRVSLLKKEKKTIGEDLSAPALGVQKFIIYAVSYYLQKGNIYYLVNNKRSLFNALKDRNKEVRKFIRKNGLSVRNDKENTLLKVTAWYNGFNQ